MGRGTTPHDTRTPAGSTAPALEELPGPAVFLTAFALVEVEADAEGTVQVGGGGVGGGDGEEVLGEGGEVGPLGVEELQVGELSFPVTELGQVAQPARPVELRAAEAL